MKTYKELLDFQKNLFSEIHTDPENAFTHFKTNWRGFSVREKRNVNSMVITYCQDIIEDELTHDPQIDESKYFLRKMCAREILNLLEDENKGKPDFGNLKIGNEIGVNDLVLVFRLLYDFRYIDNNISEIGPVIKNVFDLPDNTTVLSNFYDKEKLSTAYIEFRNRIMGYRLTDYL